MTERFGYTLVAVATIGLLLMIEFIMVYINPFQGLLGYAVAFVLLLVFGTMNHFEPFKRAFYSLSFIPLLRLISFSLPYNILPLYTWDLMRGLALCTAIIPFRFLFRPLSSNNKITAFTLLTIIIAAIYFGIGRYIILRPDILIFENPVETAVSYLGLFFLGGLLEGYLLHRIIQPSLRTFFTKWINILVVAVLFAGLQIGFYSGLYILFMFLQTLFFSRLAASSLNFPIAVAYGFVAVISIIILPILFSS